MDMDATGMTKIQTQTLQEAEDLFISAIERLMAIDAHVFVVVGSGPPEGLVDRIRERCEVVVDDSFGDAAVILSGDASEWDSLRDTLKTDGPLQ